MIEDCAEISNLCLDLVETSISSNNVVSNDDILKIRGQIMDNISNLFLERLDNKNFSIDFICSKEITIEVVDDSSNNMFRRNLDIEYIENSNGLKLIGENINGETSEIVFLSNNAVDKINDLLGKGLNNPRCNNHN